MSVVDWLSIALVGAGVLFFIAGSIGLLRLPDVMTRLHALTKADNVGLGLVVLGLAFQAAGPVDVIRLLLVWALALLTSSCACYLVAHATLQAPSEKRHDG
ncbi:MAG: monovalent cation/H(+) antiporter subunit G [Hyphomicrobiaceae bacterium]